jgi:AcrR family transcriptional regulator
MDEVPTTARLGRPRNDAAVSHGAILNAVYELLQERHVRDVTMEAIARRAKVGKPTLYKWWPSKAGLIMAMFQERLTHELEMPATGTAEEAIRLRMRHAIAGFRGLFGKVMADLIAEGQSEPAVLKELYDGHIRLRRAATAAEIERAKADGELAADTDTELIIDTMFAPIYLRLLMRFAPVTEEYGDALVDEAFRRHRGRI